jgi:hypothetical protein
MPMDVCGVKPAKAGASASGLQIFYAIFFIAVCAFYMGVSAIILSKMSVF